MLFAQHIVHTVNYDKQKKIELHDTYFIYADQRMELNHHSYLVDSDLLDAEVSKRPYVFNSVVEALTHVNSGTETTPMTIYIAPGVYWIDDPDAPDIRYPEEGNIPFGIKVKCEWLKLVGLTKKPRDVVLASNRGQTMGAVGNFTMFYFEGDGLEINNITMGNYCNVDLVYPLNPNLNRPKRSSTIVQAQLAICNGDKIVARNCRFISRLNTCPLVGGKRTLFHQCYFECTDDALSGTGVYLDCKFSFYSSKPFYSTYGTGAVFLNCDINVHTKKKQYLTKVESPVTMVDTRFYHQLDSLYVGWTQNPSGALHNYQYNVTLNGNKYHINPDMPELTIDMAGKHILGAYRLEHKGRIMYNTYNLLRGDDDWDPMQIKDIILQAEHDQGKSFTDIPTQLQLSPSKGEVVAGEEPIILKTKTMRSGNYPHSQNLQWHVPEQDSKYITLNHINDNEYTVTGTNNTENKEQVTVYAFTTSGLKAASILTSVPSYLDPPAFTRKPQIKKYLKDKLKITYTLDLNNREDQSLITWYRCKSKDLSDTIPVSVSRLDTPQQIYKLSAADAGYYVAASVSPKHTRSHTGHPQVTATSYKIKEKDTLQTDYYTDFKNFPVSYQPEIIPGFWTVDAYKPLDTHEYNWTPNPYQAWKYDLGTDGAQGTGLIQATRGARLLYLPPQNKCKDMHVELTVDPCKTAGQGFGSATGQYMDIYIKFDPYTLTGYALRVERTTKHDKAVDFTLMKYENGIARQITQPVSSTCYRTSCTITLSVTGDILTAHASTTAELLDTNNSLLAPEVFLNAEILPNDFGGTGVQHTGSTGASATMLKSMGISWK